MHNYVEAVRISPAYIYSCLQLVKFAFFFKLAQRNLQREILYLTFCYEILSIFYSYIFSYSQ